MSITKQCTKCGEVKALDAFYAQKSGKYGRFSSCKECVRRYNEENKDRNSETSRKYRLENKGKVLKYQRKYREENKGLLTEYGRKYYGENRERLKEQMRKYQKENPDVYRRANNKRRALLRNLPHQPLTPQQYDILHRQKYEIFGGNASGN